MCGQSSGGPEKNCGERLSRSVNFSRSSLLGKALCSSLTPLVLHLLSHTASHISIVSCAQTMVENYPLERVLWLDIDLQT
jgi:hypothetical protein